MPRLVLSFGTADERTFQIDHGATVGRMENAHIPVFHKSLSRTHATFEVLPEGVFVQDLRSKNGTFVNEQRVDRAPLKAGDTVRFGEISFTFDPPHEVTEEHRPAVVRPVVPRYSRDDFRTFLVQEESPSSSSALKLRATGDANRTHDKLQILLRMSQVISGSTSIESMCSTALDLAFEVLDIDRAVILLVDEKTGRLSPQAMRKSLGSTDSDGTYSRRIAEHVLQRGVAALFADPRGDSRLATAESVYRQSICASLCVPLKPGDHVLGVLYVDNQSTPNRFTEEDLEFLAAFANQVAVAIENAQLARRVQQEEVLRSNLSRFFPPAALARLRGSSQGHIDTIDTEITALFCDISEFTRMSETMEPRAIVELLNEYFPPMADIVFRLDGTLEKYIGDAMLCVWGAPFRHDDDPDRALAAAVDMQRTIKRLNVAWSARTAAPAPLHVHIGLSTGPVAAGNIGSDRFLQYATIGDTTNLAARVCGIAKPREIIITRSTYESLREKTYAIDALPPTPIRGKDKPVELFRVLWE
jgi:adenylate cyclase